MIWTKKNKKTKIFAIFNIEKQHRIIMDSLWGGEKTLQPLALQSAPPKNIHCFLGDVILAKKACLPWLDIENSLSMLWQTYQHMSSTHHNMFGKANVSSKFKHKHNNILKPYHIYDNLELFLQVWVTFATLIWHYSPNPLQWIYLY